MKKHTWEAIAIIAFCSFSFFAVVALAFGLAGNPHGTAIMSFAALVSVVAMFFSMLISHTFDPPKPTARPVTPESKTVTADDPE